MTIAPLLGKKALFGDYRTWIAILCAAFAIASNVGILFVYRRTLRFGISITKGRWRYIDDGDAIAILGLWSHALQAITILVGGWALAQLWSRRLYSGLGASLAALQSLDLFASLASLLTAWLYLFQKRYASRSALWLYIPLLLCASLLQYYPTAVLILVAPNFHEVTDVEKIHAQTEPFMSDPANGTPCVNLTDDRLDVCLGSWYLGDAVQDVLIYSTYIPQSDTFDGEELPRGRRPMWGLTGADNFSAVFLTCLNTAVLDGVLQSHDFSHSISYAASIPAIVPTLVSQCVQLPQSSNISEMTIGDASYRVPATIPLLMNGYAAGQVTTNNMSLILTFPSLIPSANVHCAVNLSLSDGRGSSMVVDFQINQTSSRLDYLGQDDDIVNQDGKLTISRWEPIAAFARIWLLGMGWSEEPVQNAMSLYISDLGLSVGSRPHFTNRNTAVGHTFEAYSIIMMADGVSEGFPPWQNNSESTGRLQSYSIQRTVLYLGARTATRYIACGVLALDTLFLLWCLWIILSGGGWYPDWSSPAALACTAICSNPIAGYEGSTKGDIDSVAWKIWLQLDPNSNEDVIRFIPKDTRNVEQTAQGSG
ncbi:unnamed protein product [Somion occarium]|uniref:Uncharacterized protein n=1 Tax=Somion occarium TaxID=3059160 RepID=A0ABP1DYI4_9APHY